MPKGTLYETWPPDHPALNTQVVIWIPTERQRRMYREWQQRKAKLAQPMVEPSGIQHCTDRKALGAIDPERTEEEV